MLALTVFAISVSAANAAAESINQRDSGYKVETVADGLDYPWSIAFLPNGDYLVALRIGEVRRISAQGDIGEPLTGLPDAYVASQGGYFDIMLDPDFSTNQTIYLSFACHHLCMYHSRVSDMSAAACAASISSAVATWPCCTFSFTCKLAPR